MSLSNPNSIVTEERLSEFYQGILPYLGGSAEAGFTPVGTIISVMGNSAPANYLTCNGQVVNIVDYPELATYFEQQFGSKNYFGGDGTTTFAVPDLRGEFLRGTGTNGHTDQGNGADVGVHQNATIIPNIHGTTVGSQATNTVANYDKYFSNQGTRRYIASSSTDNNVHAFTARPTNTSVLYCIATKNIYLNPSLDYSTDEKVVGTWIDGKPLYQRVLQLNFGTVSAQGTFVTVEYPIESLGLINIDYIFIASAWAPSVGGGYSCYPIPYTTTEGHQIKCTVHPSGKIQLISSTTSFSGVTARLIVQYTKTTD